MKLRPSLFIDAFLGSGVSLAGDPLTAFQNVPLLGLRTATILDNCKPIVRDVVKVRFIATNCSHRPIELIPPSHDSTQRHPEHSEDSLLTLLPGEAFQDSFFRSWDTPGQYLLALAYQARCADQPFARLVNPAVAIYVQPPESASLMPWLLWSRMARSHLR